MCVRACDRVCIRECVHAHVVCTCMCACACVLVCLCVFVCTCAGTGVRVRVLVMCRVSIRASSSSHADSYTRFNNAWHADVAEAPLRRGNNFMDRCTSCAFSKSQRLDDQAAPDVWLFQKAVARGGHTLSAILVTAIDLLPRTVLAFSTQLCVGWAHNSVHSDMTHVLS